MSSFCVVFLLSLLTLPWPAFGAACQPRALQLPYKNNRLVTQVETRGVLWQIGGTTPQNITLMPSAWYNDTYLWSTGPPRGWCPTGYSQVRCATYRGGLYDPSNSQTETEGPNLVAHFYDDTIANWTKDDIRLQDNTSLPQYEFGIRTNSVNSFVQKGEIGLGSASSFLKTLQDIQKISSKSYSFFWGSEVTSPSRDGSLTLGGYDQALIGDGSNVTVPFSDDPRCKEGIIVNITSIDLSGKNAWEGLPALQVCVIAANGNIMTIPVSHWDPIQAAMGAELYPFKNGTAETYYYNTTIIKQASATYTGDMGITVNDAMTITIPNNQLIFGERYITDSGLIQAKPDIKQIPIVRIAPGDSMMPRIGGLFFSSAYLMVNHDKNQFTIAPAQTKSAPSKLMAFDTANDCVGVFDAAAASATPGAPQPSSGSNNGGSNNGGSSSGGSGSSSSSNSGNTTPEDSKSALSGGAIAGIVIGVLAGLALIAGIAFVLLRRRRANAPAPAELAAFSQHQQPAVEKYGYNSSELYVDGNEMSGSDGSRYELDGGARPYEMPSPGEEPARRVT